MRVLFLGSPDFAIPTLDALLGSEHEVVAVCTQPDRPTGRGRRLAPTPVKELALARGIPVLQPRSVSSARSVAQLQALAPDVGVIAAYGQILRQPVLDVPRHGILNVHASLLPRWRGAAPVAAAIRAGDRETGATIMRVVLALDAGPMLARATVAIGDGDTTATLTPRVAAAGARLLLDVLPGYARGELPAAPQDDAQATYAPQLTKEDGRIDWARPAREIWRQVRACDPWPVAFTTFEGAPLRILACLPLAGAGGAPGAVAACEPGDPAAAGFRVVTGDGAVGVLRVQAAGRPATDAAAWLRGRRSVIGARFG